MKERRLCYFGAPEQPGSPEATPVAEVILTREQIHEQNKNRLLHHLGKTLESIISERLQKVLDNPEALEKELRMWETKQEDRLKETTAMFRVDLEESKTVIHQWNAGKAQQRVLAIIKELQKNIPKKGVAGHRYGTTEGLAFQVIRDDQQFIDGMLTADNPPEISTALSRVRSSLSYLAEQDMGNMGWKYQQEKGANKFDTTIKGMGKMTIIIVALFGGILTGIPAIARMIKEGKMNFSSLIAPLLCFGIAVPLMSADFRRQFASLESNLKTDLNVTIRNPLFRDLCTKYNIQGTNWSRAFQRMHDHPEKMKTLASHYRSNAAVPNPNELEKEINSFVRFSGLQGDEAIQLRSMIDKGQLPYLSDTLGRVETKDGKGVLLDYVRIGAKQYEKQAYATADAMKNTQQKDA